ncbi:hypothetical protein Bbelb_052030 [Branchiostoma belcheri]|nr:hypothetical protein Bbelb_052030 [Branchiostoma belcheri]
METVWEALVRCERRWLWAFVVVCLVPTVTEYRVKERAVSGFAQLCSGRDGRRTDGKHWCACVGKGDPLVPPRNSLELLGVDPGLLGLYWRLRRDGSRLRRFIKFMRGKFSIKISSSPYEISLSMIHAGGRA